MLTEPIPVRPGGDGRLIVQLPYSPDHVAKIKTVDGCGQKGGFGQARHLSHVLPFLCDASAGGQLRHRTVQELLGIRPSKRLCSTPTS
jgi:hypothetical protein